MSKDKWKCVKQECQNGSPKSTEIKSSSVHADAIETNIKNGQPTYRVEFAEHARRQARRGGAGGFESVPFTDTAEVGCACSRVGDGLDKVERASGVGGDGLRDGFLNIGEAKG